MSFPLSRQERDDAARQKRLRDAAIDTVLVLIAHGGIREVVGKMIDRNEELADEAREAGKEVEALVEKIQVATREVGEKVDALVEKLRVAEERVSELEAILVDHVREGRVGNPIDLGDDEEDIGAGIKKRKKRIIK